MSPSGLVSSRIVKPGPGPVVTAWTMFAANNRSALFVVRTEPLLLGLVVLARATVTSTGLVAAMLLYSRMRTSVYCARVLNLTVTVFSPGFAFAILLA